MKTRLEFDGVVPDVGETVSQVPSSTAQVRL
jgi:hypothetical protein